MNNFATHSGTVLRRYRYGNEWKFTQSFRASDLLMFSFAAQEAYRRVNLLRQMMFRMPHFGHVLHDVGAHILRQRVPSFRKRT